MIKILTPFSLSLLQFLFLTFFISSINSLNYKSQISHPIQIRLDFTNLEDNYKNIKLLSLLEQSKEIISQLVYINKVRKLKIDEKSLKKRCKIDLNFEKPLFNKFDEDMIIFILSEDKYYGYNKNFKAEICKKENDFVFFRNVVLFKISTSFLKIINTINDYNIIKLEILRTLTDCLGLIKNHMQNTRQPKNNFFAVPNYLLQYSTSFLSLKKLYNLLNQTLPETTISENGEFYIQYWNENSVIKDFRSQKILDSFAMSEISINLLNDMDFYSITDCDFNFDVYGKCLRFDKNCIDKKEINKNYILYYGLSNNDNKLYCYLSNSDNLKNNQCGNKYYGNLINEIQNYTPKILKDKIPKIKLSDYEIPEISDFTSQKLKLFTPKKSKFCKNRFARTIYLTSEYRTINETDNTQIDEIIFNETQKKYFVTFQTYENKYSPFAFIRILKNNGLIRSYVHLGNHNFIKNSLSEQVYNERGGDFRINKYQKVCHLFSGYSLGNKGSMDINYKKMHDKFPKAYNFMPESYDYPEDKKIIKKKFKKYKIKKSNLWLVKPKNGLTGRGIYFYGTIQKKLKNCIISKYISNPHLLNGKKYDLRIFVLITGVNPLRIYLYKEGLARISAENYSLDITTLNDTFIHLTNTGINSKNKNYIFPKNSFSEDANKWNLNTYKNFLEKNNINYNEIRKKIADIVIKTIISTHHLMLEKFKKYEVNDRSFFKIYGFDILIDDELNPHLLEVNTRPDMHIYDKMDRIVKQNIFVDSLNLVGITPFSHDEEQKTYDKEFEYEDKIEEAVDYAYCERERPKGDFDLIFPVKNNVNKYKEFFVEKTEVNERFWEKIQNEE